jgi:hypothetical protein
MSIMGLIPSLMEVGKIKIGVKGAMMESTTGTEFRPPKKLDHFIITTNERDEHGDFRIDEPLMESLKKSKRAIKDASGNLIGIPVRLLYNDIDLNFQPKTTTTPDGSITTVYAVAVVFPGGVDKLQEESLKIHRDKMEYLRNMDQMEHYARKQLENTGAVTDDEEKDIAEEFYPEAIKDQVVELEPESKDAEAETEIAPPVDEEKEPSEVTVSTGPVTTAQLKKMAGLKKDLWLDKESWEKLLVPYDVPTAKQMTTELADKFLLELENELVPF